MKMKKLLSIFLCLEMLLGLLPALGGAARAAALDPVSYIKRSWDDSAKTMKETEQSQQLHCLGFQLDAVERRLVRHGRGT